MKHWDLSTTAGDAAADGSPEIITSGDHGRAVLISLAAGKSLDEHEVHEQAWVVVLSGDVEVAAADGEAVAASAGHMFEFEPTERHRVAASTDAKILLVLVPWPGEGHPGAMDLADKSNVRASA